MDITIVRLDKEHTELIDRINSDMLSIQKDLDSLTCEFQQAMNVISEIKSRITPLKDRLAPLAEMKSGIASRKSRFKYFPEFATRNFDDSKDDKYLEYVRGKL